MVNAVKVAADDRGTRFRIDGGRAAGFINLGPDVLRLEYVGVDDAGPVLLHRFKGFWRHCLTDDIIPFDVVATEKNVNHWALCANWRIETAAAPKTRFSKLLANMELITGKWENYWPFGDKEPDIVDCVRVIPPPGVSYDRRLAYLDAVLEGVWATIWHEVETGGKRFWTLAQVWRLLAGTNGRQQPGAAALDEVKDGCERLRQTVMYLDDRSEAKKRRKLDEGSYIELDGGRHARRIFQRVPLRTIEKDGVIVGYEITAAPLVYQNAAMSGQILTAPFSLLDIRQGKNSTARIMVKWYLLHRVDAMIHSPKETRFISFSSLLEAIGAATKGTQANRLKKYALKVLDSWTAAGFIKGYAPRKRGKALHGVEIVLDTKPASSHRKKVVMKRG